jgi:hypothetical protein
VKKYGNAEEKLIELKNASLSPRSSSSIFLSHSAVAKGLVRRRL